MRTLAIGDIHGCLDPLLDLWKAIEPTPEDHIIFLGDYVDRGPDSKGVIDFLISVQQTHNVTILSGNHEEKFLLANLASNELSEWSLGILTQDENDNRNAESSLRPREFRS